ncbi:hypothetical protein [Nitratireductor soli]|uniref:hypothetical protein n=1 Tax=Nitratireductor soli TaxID=1670619 RepID=UPI00065E458C|nr:hypothetical protein [Nitratireductor soli]
MAVEKFQFHKTEKGMGNEDWYSLIRDGDTGEIHILHEWSHHAGNFQFRRGEANIPLDEFMKGGGTRQDKLQALLDEKGWS